MKLHFKNVGDTFTLDEYNAICYLLSKREYTEDIQLEEKDMTGEYGSYTLIDNNNCIMEKHGGFVVLSEYKTFTFKIKPLLENAVYSLVFTVKREGEVKDTVNNITTKTSPDELYDNPQDSLKSTVTKFTKEVTVDSNQITITPHSIGIYRGDYIDKTVKVSIKYSEPIINWEDGGANTDDQIICNNFEELQQVIETAPEGSDVSIRLKGAEEYFFTEELYIGKNKSVTIEGGNYTNDSHTKLNGMNKYRLFTIAGGSSLTVINCSMYNGNGSRINKASDMHQRGGAVYMGGHYENLESVYQLITSTATFENCKFFNCHANRGGAIYNNMGRLVCNNCYFSDCYAESGNWQANWGGAIMCESKGLYGDSSNQLRINNSEVTYSGDTTTIDLQITEQQNIKAFTKADYNISSVKLRYNNTTYNCTKVKANQFHYIITVQGFIPPQAVFYLITPDFTSRLLKINKIGTKYYAQINEG